MPGARSRKRIAIELKQLDRARLQAKPCAIQQPTFNSSGRGWCSSSMCSFQRDAPSQGRVGQSLRSNLFGRLKYDEVGNRPGGRSAAERAILKICMLTRVMRMARHAMRVVRGHLHRKPVRTNFEQKRSAARRHEAERHIGSKQQYRQHPAGRQISLPMMSKKAHGLPCTLPEWAAGFHSCLGGGTAARGPFDPADPADIY